MSRKILLSKRASTKLDKLLNYLETKWSEKVKKDFIKKIDKSLSQIKKSPDSFPKTDFVQGIYKCVITKQTTLYYRYNNQEIIIITLFDNRQDPEKLKKETQE